MPLTDTARIFEKLDAIGTDVAVVKTQLPSLDQRIADHEKRIRSLETRVWYSLGFVGVLAIAVPLVVEWFANQS